MIEETSEEEDTFMMTVEQIGSGVTSIQGLVDQIEDAQNAGQTYLQLPEELDPAKTNVTLERIFDIARQFIEQTLAIAEETDSQITQVINYGDRNSTALVEYSTILGDHRENLSQLSSELFMLQSLDMESNDMPDAVMPGRMETPFSAGDTPNDVDPNTSLLAIIDMDLTTGTPTGDDPPEAVSPLDLDETSYGTPTDNYESFTTVDPDFEEGYGEDSVTSYPTPTDDYGEPIIDETSFETAETDSFGEETTVAPYEVMETTLPLNLVDSQVDAGDSENSLTEPTPLSSDAEDGYLDVDAYGNDDEGLPVEDSTYPDDVTPTDLYENGDGLTDDDFTEDTDDVTQDENTYPDDVTPTDLNENGDGLTDDDVTEDADDVTPTDLYANSDGLTDDDVTRGADDVTQYDNTYPDEGNPADLYEYPDNLLDDYVAPTVIVVNGVGLTDEDIVREGNTYPDDVTSTDLHENGDGLTDDDVVEDTDDVAQDETDENTYPDDVTQDETDENTYPDDVTQDETDENTYPDDVTEDETDENTYPDDVTEDETDENTYPDDVMPTDSIESDDVTEGTDDATAESDENGYTNDLSYLSNESGYDLTDPTTENELIHNLSEILSNEDGDDEIENSIENLYPGFGTDEPTETQTDYATDVTTSSPINEDEFSNVLAESWSNDGMDNGNSNTGDSPYDPRNENSFPDDNTDNTYPDDDNTDNTYPDDDNTDNTYPDDDNTDNTDDVNDLDSENRYTNESPDDVLNDESYEYDNFDSEYTARLGLGIGISLVCIILAVILIIIRCKRIANRRQFVFQRFDVPQENFIKQPNLTPNSTIITVPWQHVPIQRLKPLQHKMIRHINQETYR
ncbi:uncharacterized protein LOC144749668 [Ciona intestinalis]